MYVVYVGVVYVSSSKRKGLCDEDAEIETESDYGDDSRNGNCND
jgi:hypothetical protein